MAKKNLKSLVTLPTYTLYVKSLDKKIEYEPFVVAEQKNLLMAAKSKDPTEIIRAMSNLVDSCVTERNFKAADLPIFELIHIFLNIRAVSVEELIDLKYRCNAEVKVKNDEGVEEDGKCTNEIPIRINIQDVQISYPEEVSDSVMLTDTLGIKLRYPNIKDLQSIQGKDDEEITTDMIAQCIVAIFDDGGVYPSDEYETVELVEFLESLSSKQFIKIRTFFEDMPKLEHTVKFTCNKCKTKHEVVLSDIADFF